MPVYNVGTPVNTHATAGSVTGTWGANQFRVAGHLLVAVVTCGASTSVTATGTVSGWVNRFEQPNSGTANVRVAIWTKTAAGSDAAPVFTTTVTGTGAMDCMLFELSSANTTTPVDVSAVYASGAVAGTVTGTATTGTLAGRGEFVLSCFAQNAAAGNLTFTDTGTSGFSRLLNGNGVSSVLQTYVGTVNPVATTAVNDAGTFSVNTTAFGAGVVAAFALTPATPAINTAYANNAAATVTAGGKTAPAGGTSEAWTVNVTGAFPVASTTAQPPTQFTVCDPALPAEKFLVTVAPGGTGGAQSWTVTRGAEGTTPAAHAAGFTIVDVTTAGFLTGVSKELSASAYVDCDYTGTADASTAFNAALASLPVINGYPSGTIIFGPGTVKIAVTPNNPGSSVYVQGAGRYATTINSFVTGGDCFRVFDPGQSGTSDTNNCGGFSGLTIRGDNAGAGAVGLHAGDLDNYHVDIVVINFQGAGSKGIWFDNEYFFTEQLYGDVVVSGCTQCVVFDNPATAANTSGSSFARIQMTIRLLQGLDGTGQVWGDGVVLQNGALIIDADLAITGNFVMSAASTSAAVLRLTGAVPAGHLNAGRITAISSSRLHIGVECDTSGANANAPMTIFSDGTADIERCYGQLDFGAGSASFAASNAGPLLKACNFQVSGDNALGAAYQVFMTEQFQAITAGYTLGAGTTAQKLLNATANGALTIKASTTFFFECVFSITGLSASAHTVSFGFGGTATYTSCAWQALTTAGGTGGAAALYSATSNAATAITAAGITTTTLQAVIKGVIRTNATGTLIPQITNATNGIAAVVAANSYFRLTPVGTDSLASAGFGNWT